MLRIITVKTPIVADGTVSTESASIGVFTVPSVWVYFQHYLSSYSRNCADDGVQRLLCCSSHTNVQYDILDGCESVDASSILHLLQATVCCLQLALHLRHFSGSARGDCNSIRAVPLLCYLLFD